MIQWYIVDLSPVYVTRWRRTELPMKIWPSSSGPTSTSSPVSSVWAMWETSVRVVLCQNQYLSTQSPAHCQGRCTTMSSVRVHFQDKCTIKRVFQAERLTMKRTASHWGDRDRDLWSKYRRAVWTPRQMENIGTKDFSHCRGTTEQEGNTSRTWGWGEPRNTNYIILPSVPPLSQVQDDDQSS